jgi:hypothetical protein
MRIGPTNRIRFWTCYLSSAFGSISRSFVSSLLCAGGVILLALAASARFSPSPHETALAASPQKPGAQVPFVGCASDGQVGPVSAPISKSMVLLIAADAAQRLAYYKAEEGAGVLAPRGWHCFCMYGSNGSSLYVSPQPIVPTDLLSTNWGGFGGPIIEITAEDGDTSGRFGVAATIARVFPAHREFVDKVMAERIWPASSFVFGPYPADRLIYRSNEAVEYQTPGNADGLGTESRLKKNATPISGVAILMGQTPDLLQLSVRLPQNLADLTPVIIQQTERDASRNVDR